MYSLTVHFGPNAIMWQFLFKDLARAKIANTPSRADHIIIEDDFGQFARIETKQIHGTLLEDFELMEEARILRSLADARANAKFQARARTDSVIRAAQTGAPVLTPMGGGFRQ